MHMRRREFTSIALLASLPYVVPSIGAARETRSSIDILSDQIAKLEADARALKLPELSGTRAPLGGPLTRRNYYENGMPRLVDLAERARVREDAANLANNAGKLLSELNETEKGDIGDTSRTRAPTPSADSLKAEYTDLFSQCEITQNKQSLVAWHTAFITKHKNEYLNVVNGSEIPWYFVGIVHGLEASYNFLAHLHNGDFPLSEVTQHVPKGRPQPWLPPFEWASSARDAFRYQGLWEKKDWSLHLILYRLEAYNGFGYHSKKINSPYLWAFSNNYKSGKFVQDHRFDPKKESQQCGGAVILKAMAEAGQINV
ncbi:hypothetical protein CO663_16995 [Rhizobium anhuiense]|uniref:hypothetical protein n=1 Tax=Rhizobium anhuiense TaxID=1184720 RepID=UPI000BE96E4B|nr:hypothetical protein [Rhizobium anhuiense]PDS57775.1 hypothetical protein CO663_16995 [Rhizobium anhuiense]